LRRGDRPRLAHPGRRETIKVDTIGAKEPKLENYVVRRLIERDAVDYEQNAELPLQTGWGDGRSLRSS